MSSISDFHFFIVGLLDCVYPSGIEVQRPLDEMSIQVPNELYLILHTAHALYFGGFNHCKNIFSNARIP